MRAIRGLRGRVVVVSSATTLVLLSLISTVGFLAMASSLRSSVENTVRDRLDTVQARIEQGDQVSRQIWPDGSDVQVVDDETAADQRAHTVRIVRPLDTTNGRIDLVGQADVAQLDETLGTIRRWLWMSVAGGSALVAGFTWLATTRALAPVAAVTAQARSIYHARRGDSLPVPDTQDEITELVQTLNEMLSRLREHEERHRRFVSDASHELRTPLMVLLADADYAGAHPEELPSLPEQVTTQVLRLRDLTDDLLALATFDEGFALPPKPVRELVEAECGEHETLKIGLWSTGSAGADVAVPDVSRSIRNLVANAHRHGDHVMVTVERASQSVQIHVDDDGPGVPPEHVEFIFNRFHRGDASRSRQSGGNGLGLAIAQAEVTAAGGTIGVSTSPSGGARFTIVLPTIESQPN